MHQPEPEGQVVIAGGFDEWDLVIVPMNGDLALDRQVPAGD
jgi:hypothetical protein